jgi:GntR family transcriptional regulator
VTNQQEKEGPHMQLDFQAEKSIYLQIAEQVEDSILQNALEEEEQAPSTNQLAALYRVNPATAAKGIRILVDEGILYKRRGIGMFVATGACARIREKRRDQFYDSYIQPLLAEAGHLGISAAEICSLIVTRQQDQAKMMDQQATGTSAKETSAKETSARETSARGGPAENGSSMEGATKP